MGSSLARRYAKALIEIGREDDSVETLLAELIALRDALDESPELAATLYTPTIDIENKSNIAAAVLEKLDASETARNFVGLLVQKGRFGHFRDIVGEFARQADEAMGRLRAHLTCAKPPSDELKKRITDKLSKVTGKQIKLDVRVDPDLLGGLIAEVRGVVYDASVRSQLRALQNTSRTRS